MARYQRPDREERRAQQDQSLQTARATGVSASGQQITGWADSRTPTVAGKSGLTSGQGLTDPLTWANQFRRIDSQLTSLPSPIPAVKSLATAQTPSITQGVLSEIMQNPFAGSFNLSLQTGQSQNSGGLNFGTNPVPSVAPLKQLAAGGQNHAASWLENAKIGMERVGPYSDPRKPMSTLYGRPQPERSGYSWASAFR